MVKTIGNILWLFLVGWHTAIGWLLLGLLLCSPSSPSHSRGAVLQVRGLHPVALRPGGDQESGRSRRKSGGQHPLDNSWSPAGLWLCRRRFAPLRDHHWHPVRHTSLQVRGAGDSTLRSDDRLQARTPTAVSDNAEASGHVWPSRRDRLRFQSSRRQVDDVGHMAIAGVARVQPVPAIPFRRHLIGSPRLAAQVGKTATTPSKARDRGLRTCLPSPEPLALGSGIVRHKGLIANGVGWRR